MARLFYVLILVITLSFQDFVTAQNQACMNISQCLKTKEFKNALKDKNAKDFCSTFRKALECMDPQIASCLPSLPDPSMAAMFTQQRERMSKSMDKCKNKGGSSSSSSDDCAKKMAKCTEGIGSTDIGMTDHETACKTVKEVEACLEDVGPSCSGDMEAYNNMVKQMKIVGDSCANGGVGQASAGCTEDMTTCSKEMGAAAASGPGDLAVLCRKMKAALDCFKGITSCSGSMQSSLERSITAAEAGFGQCKGTGEGGSMGTCNINELQACMKNEPKSLEEVCKVGAQILKCIQNFESKCKMAELEMVIMKAKEGITEQMKNCGGKAVGGGDGGDMGGNGGSGSEGDKVTCDVSALGKCTPKKPETKEEECKMIKPAIKCISNFADNCKIPALEDVVKSAQEGASAALKNCEKEGYSTEPGGNAAEIAKPSYILALTAAFLMALFRIQF